MGMGCDWRIGSLQKVVDVTAHFLRKNVGLQVGFGIPTFQLTLNWELVSVWRSANSAVSARQHDNKNEINFCFIRFYKGRGRDSYFPTQLSWWQFGAIVLAWSLMWRGISDWKMYGFKSGFYHSSLYYHRSLYLFTCIKGISILTFNL